MSIEHNRGAEVDFYGTKFKSQPDTDIQLYLMGVITGVQAGKTLEQIHDEDLKSSSGSELYDDAYEKTKATIEKAIKFYIEEKI